MSFLPEPWRPERFPAQALVEVLEEVRDHRDRVRGLEITWQAKVLRHFTARFREMG